MSDSLPTVIAHRGACSLLPEHTLAAYELAIDQGADFIEPDVVPTKDGVLVARHENFLACVAPPSNPPSEPTTDVMDHPEFAARRTTKTVDGTDITGWFIEDFTFAEIKTLRAREPFPLFRRASAQHNDEFPIASLEEILDLVERKAGETGRRIGIYPEIKHPTYFRALGLPIEERLIELLHSRREVPAFIQCFEVDCLQALHGMTDLPLVQLIGGEQKFADLRTRAGLAEVARYARVISPDKDLIIPRDAEGKLTQPTALVNDAHAAGLLVHPWVFRDEDPLLPTDLRGNPRAEYGFFFQAGVDGVLTDATATAIAARDAFSPRA
jgi:glycerophosphoryl diester phosphodiesterase